MKILGIDTTTKFLCLAIYDNARIYECNLEMGRRHSALLHINIKRSLDAARISLADIDYFACGLGPGSFTGVRVGLSAIKGFAWVLKKPVLGVSTLDIVARNALYAAAAGGAGYVMPAIDARRNLIYCSVYKLKNGALKRIMPYMLLSEKEFLQRIKNGTVILGDAAALYKDSITESNKCAVVLSKDYWYPSARNIIPLALEKIAAKVIDTAFKVEPIYLYPKECQIRKPEVKRSNEKN